MRYLSVCSGIEAATVAWHPLGWTPVAFSEIDRFPSAVLAHHYPDVPNLGDMTRFKEWPDAAFDVLVGGTPCQSFSVAGLRAGLADPRGNLALTYLAIADRYRPRWVVWENVPGVLSSTSHTAPDPSEPPPPLDLGCDGAEVETEDEYSSEELHAFQCFLAGLSELGYGWCYRSLDAQYFRLAQRRRRVFVVGHLGDWRRAAAVLLERASLSGHPAPRREAGEGVARPITQGSPGGGGYRNDADSAENLIASSTAGTLGAHSSSGRLYGSHPITDSLVAFGGNNTSGAIDVAAAVRAKGGSGHSDFESETFVLSATAHPPAVTIPIDMRQASRGATMTNNRGEHVASGGAPGTGVGDDGDPSATLGTSHPPAVAFTCDTTRDGSTNVRVSHVAMRVRRLTSRECERLQGFHDDFTMIPYRGKPAADGPRYKALGNAMAVPVMAWIGRRIAMVDSLREPEERT